MQLLISLYAAFIRLIKKIHANDPIAFYVFIGAWVLLHLTNLYVEGGTMMDIAYLGLWVYGIGLVVCGMQGQQIGLTAAWNRAVSALKPAPTPTRSLTTNGTGGGTATTPEKPVPTPTPTPVVDLSPQGEQPDTGTHTDTPAPAAEPVIEEKPVPVLKEVPIMDEIRRNPVIRFTGAFLSDEQGQANQALDISGIEAMCKARIKGQDHAIDAVLNTLKRSAANIRIKAESPLCVFLFLGPTGTGKTEIVKQIALASKRPLVRFDMPNFSSEAGTWELIGSPPGYVGSEKSGRLTGEIRSNANAVLLLDEIEKAHPKIFDPFLRVLDEGKLKDQSQGFTADFKHVMIFLTSNLLQNEDFIEDEKLLRNKVSSEGFFRPELLNRIDRICMFKPFTKAIMGDIVANMLYGFVEKFAYGNKLNADISIDRSCIECTLDSIDLKYGVRDAERFIDKELGDALANAWLDVVQSGRSVSEITITTHNSDIAVVIK